MLSGKKKKKLYFFNGFARAKSSGATITLVVETMYSVYGSKHGTYIWLFPLPLRSFLHHLNVMCIIRLGLRLSRQVFIFRIFCLGQIWNIFKLANNKYWTCKFFKKLASVMYITNSWSINLVCGYIEQSNMLILVKYYKIFGYTQLSQPEFGLKWCFFISKFYISFMHN